MSALFSGPPKPPAVAVAAPMPDPTSPSVLEAQNNSTAAALQRAGRQSTILGKQGGVSAPATPTAADSFTGSKLGAQ